MRVLIVDNYDSFTFNLYHYIAQFTDSVDVIKNDKVQLENIKLYDKIILSPGPGLPNEHKNLSKILYIYSDSKSILGVCLGHQAIGEFFGAELLNLSEVKHGISTEIRINGDKELFSGIPTSIKVGHYHSWIIQDNHLPSCLKVTSRSHEGFITSIQHSNLDVRGVQFHPESILTDYGLKIIENWINI